MNLRTKLLLGIGIALIVTFALVAVFLVISMEESYRTLEEKEVMTTVTRAESSLATDEKNLRSITRDYAAWTDTYNFAQGKNPDWIATNTRNDFFERFNIQGVLVFNRSAEPVFTKGYNATLSDSEEIPASLVPEIQAMIRSDVAILNTSEGTYRILDSAAGPIIVSSHPILTDNFEGPAAGTLLIIRKVDTRYLSDISARAGKTVTIIPSPQITGNQTIAGIVAGISPGHPVEVVEEGPDTISGYTALDNLKVPGTFYLKVSEPRTIYQSGLATTIRFLLSLMVAGIFIIAFVLLVIDRIVLSRLNAIIGSVRQRKDTDSERGTNGGNDVDELGRLATEIDPVFQKLTESRILLQQSEERYRMLAESAQDFIYIIDTSDRITYVNTFAATAVGRKPEEIIGKSRSVLFPDTESERQQQNIRTVITSGQPVKIESNLPLPSGERWADTLLVPLRDRTGTITGVMGITRDITQRKKVEEALFQTNKKLNLLSSITRHDLLNQLTALRTYLELSLDYTRDPEMTDFIKKEQVIASIIDQQINFTRDYQQMGVNAPVWHDVSGIIAWTIQPLATSRVRITEDCKGLEVFADPLLEKVFYNLVENALRYGGENLSLIHIFSTKTPDELRIIVEDNGVGIPDENKERIFERGFGHNTGFGLFLSREILGITGMTITETGTFGKGARFEILVPKGHFRFVETGSKAE
jgi:PAS domain S-box-containing protein